jgi:thiol-disulfide isomerase/thioredoxin
MNTPDPPVAQPAQKMRQAMRRRTVFGALLVSAAAVGSVAWWRGRWLRAAAEERQATVASADDQDEYEDVDGESVDADIDTDWFWSLKFASLNQSQGQGDKADMAMADLRGSPLLVNFWATWCAPCQEELPILNHFYLQNRADGLQVIGLALDGASLVRPFLARQPVAFPVALAGQEGGDVMEKLGNDGGSVPFTVLFDADGALLRQWVGGMDADDLDELRQMVSSLTMRLGLKTA